MKTIEAARKKKQKQTTKTHKPALEGGKEQEEWREQMTNEIMSLPQTFPPPVQSRIVSLPSSSLLLL